MNPKLNRMLRGLILLGTGGMLFFKFVNGELYYFIHQRFFYLTILAGTILLVLGYVLLTDKDENNHILGHDQKNEADHGHPGNIPNWTLAVASLPMLIGLLLPTQALDSSVVESRGLSSNQLPPEDETGQDQELSSEEREILDWIKAFNFADDASIYNGQTADVIGFVYHDDSLEENQFLVGRLAITCCVADAFAIGMVVESPNVGDFQDNDWVHVLGEVEAIDFEGHNLPLIHAESIEAITAPDQPYVFP